MQTDSARAIISQGSEHHTVGVGDRVGDYRVESIGEGRVVLGGSGGSVELELDRSARKKATPPPASPPAADTPPPVPPVGNPTTPAATEPTVDEDGGIQLEGGWRKFELEE